MAADVVPYANWRRKRAQKRFYSAHLAGLCKHRRTCKEEATIQSCGLAASLPPHLWCPASAISLQANSTKLPSAEQAGFISFYVLF